MNDPITLNSIDAFIADLQAKIAGQEAALNFMTTTIARLTRQKDGAVTYARELNRALTDSAPRKVGVLTALVIRRRYHVATKKAKKAKAR